MGNRCKPLTGADSRGRPRSPLAELFIAEHYSNDFCLIQEKSASSRTTLPPPEPQATLSAALLRVSKGGGPFWPSSLKGNGVMSCVDPRSRCVGMESSLRGAQRRSNPENVGALRSPGLLRFARNDDRGSTQMQLALGASRSNTIAFFTEIDLSRRHFAP